MSETRRDLFKTTVMTALGATAVASLGGCERIEDFLGLEDSAPVVGLADGTTQWYLFVANGSNYTVYAAKNPPSSLHPHTCPIDTLDYYNGLKYITGGLAPAKNLKNKLIGGVSITTDEEGVYIPTQSFVPVQKVLTWNEIGKT